MAPSVVSLRRQLAETPRYLLAAGQHTAFHEGATHVLGVIERSAGPLAPEVEAQVKATFRQGFAALIADHRMALRLIGASLAWFLMDFAYCGNTVGSPLVLHSITPQETLLWHILLQLAVFAIAAMPGSRPDFIRPARGLARGVASSRGNRLIGGGVSSRTF